MHVAIRNLVSVLALSAKVDFDIDRCFFEEMASLKRCKNGSGHFYVAMYNLLLDMPSKVTD